MLQKIGKHMKVEKQIFALGFFDGVHLGHQALLRRCVEMANEQGAIPAAITFSAHPKSLFADAPRLINTNEDRQLLLSKFGMKKINMYPVSEKVMSTSWQDFLEDLVDEGAVGFVCGEDFRFGCHGSGNAQALREFCRRRRFSCAIVPDQIQDGQRVSSSHIRNLIAAGDLESANLFLGHPHILTGEVISGRKLGRTIGIPTANLAYPENILLPKAGVYACRAFLDGKAYLAVTNVGTRPTVGGSHVTVEPWLLDFEGDLYGKTLTLEFHKFLRPEKKFPSLEALREEIGKNRMETLNFFLKK